MAIQWFPGHMHLTRQAIVARVKTIDVVIEMLDARLPASSANPLLAELTSRRPTLKVLNKQDMADPERTAQWLEHYNHQSGVRAIGLDTTEPAAAQRLITPCFELAPHRGRMLKPMRVMICGIPNVGKSTLINRLVGKRAAKAADEAGVTRTEQRILLADDFYLYDTPGILWPRIIVAESGYNLAASGAVGRNAFDDHEVALELLAYLQQHCARLLAERYKLELADVESLSDEVLLESIGRQRGCLMAGGEVNLQKASELLIHDFRSGSLGRITLETPGEFSQWLTEGRKLDAERQARKDLLTRQGHIRRKNTAPGSRPRQSGKGGSARGR